KGKSTWRLISARVKEVVLRPKARSALGRSYVRTLGLLERFLTGEGTHPELFDHIIACGLIAQAEQGDARAFDALSLWKVLVLLGYVAVPAEDEILFTLPLDQALAEMDDRRIKKLIQSATDAIHYSHL
ncbi:MAG: hypothetical protein JWM92_611, partial [Candidatus Nomurabacteria bacterium]|nr:hypothetical protein [Candidatus Nomurabacteria bacterium]